MSTLSGGPNIIYDGLVFNIDAGNSKSYISNNNTWFDISRTGGNCTLINGPTFNSANGGSIVFDGTNDYAITQSGITSLNIRTGITVDCWFRITQNANSLHGDGVLSKGLSSDGNAAVYEMMIRNPSGTVNYSLFRIRTSSGTSSYTPIVSGNVINLNQIYNVVSTYNGSTMRSFVNGLEVGTGNTFTGLIESNTQPMTIGVRYLMSTFGGNDAFLTGNIYSARVYNRALSSSEILQNYNSLKSRFGL